MSVCVSIVIPVYNVENLVSRCLESILNQTYDNLDIIVINDGSTDDSLKVILECKKHDTRVTIIDQKNQGLSGARNTGINSAKGEYILFVDSDDFIELTLVEDCIRRIQKDNSDIVVYGYKKVKEDLSVIAEPNLGNNLYSQEEALQKLLSLNISPMACNKFIKTSIFKENHITFPLSKLHEDVGTMYKIFYATNKITTTSKSYYYWINREESITGTLTFKHINHMIELLSEKKVFLLQNGFYEKYEKSYNIGILKLFNLMLERSLNSSKALVEYVLYNIEEEILLSHNDIAYIEDVDGNLYVKFHKLMKEAREFVDNKDITNKDFYALQKKNRYLTEELDKIRNASYYKVFMQYKTIRDMLLPKGSRRRAILKKLKG